MPKLLVGFIPFNSLSEDMGFREVLRPGCFDRWLGSAEDVVCRVEHDSRLLLARRSNATLAVWAGADGLHYEAEIPETTCGKDTRELCAAGVLYQSSFAFNVYPDDGEAWSILPNGELLRELLHVSLADVAPVACPAYRAAQVTVRSSSERAADSRVRVQQSEIDRLRHQLAESG